MDEEGGGLGLLASLLAHTILITAVLVNAPKQEIVEQEPMTYVELTQALPQAQSQGTPKIVEAPGPETERPAPLGAPLSDANRRATSPDPSGNERTNRPGLRDAPFVPGSPMPGPPSSPTQPSQPSGQSGKDESGEDRQIEPDPASDRLRFQQSSQAQKAAPNVDWSSAIQEEGKIASLGGQELGTWGGDEGFAESGPISFETQWYEWGDYAVLMIRKIRYHWYNNMPALVRMGVKGVVVIRFTIQRDGTITDITTLQSSGHPPYDFAARKALELSSPLKPLPADFPKPEERVTAAFYYNLRPPED